MKLSSVACRRPQAEQLKLPRSGLLEQPDEHEPKSAGWLALLGNVNSRPRYPILLPEWVEQALD